MLPVFYTFLHMVIVFFVLVLLWYVLIIKPQCEQSKQTKFVQQKLRQGAAVTTAHGITGTIICVLRHTLLIQTDQGEIIEVLKHAVIMVAE